MRKFTKISLLVLGTTLIIPICTMPWASFCQNSDTPIEPDTIEGPSPVDYKTEKELDNDIRRLNSRGAEKYAALNRLIDYGAPSLLRVGSVFMQVKHNDWVEKAANAVNEFQKDMPTNIYCLKHGNCTAKVWAFRNNQESKNLLPLIEQLAIDDASDSDTKILALERLALEPSYAQFLKDRAKVEKNAFVLEVLLPNENEFNAALVKALKSKDEKTRISALKLIGCDGLGGVTPTPRHSFNSQVHDEIVKLSSSASADERSNASFALTRMVSRNPQFFLPDRYDKLELKTSADELIRQQIEIVQNYIDGQGIKSDELKAKFDRCIKNMKEPSKRTSSDQPDVFVVTAPFMPKSEAEISDKDKAVPQEITVEIENTGAPILLSLQGGGRTGKNWKVVLQPGANLRKIVLTGNDLSKTTVHGNYSKDVEISSPEADPNRTYHYTSKYSPEAERGMLEKFCMAVFKQPPTTVQQIPEPQNDMHKQSVKIGPSDKDWYESFKLAQIKPIFELAEKNKNEKWLANYKSSGPHAVLLGTPSDSSGGDRIDYHVGKLNNLQASVTQRLSQPEDDPFYRQIAFDPKRNECYLLGVSGIVKVSAGKETLLVPSKRYGSKETDRVCGIVFDSKRDRLVVSRDKLKEVSILNPVNQTWSKMSFERTFGDATYSAADDSIYIYSDTHITRVDAGNGKVIEEGILPLPESEQAFQVFVDNKYAIAISRLLPCKGGFEQIARVIDKRDGTICYKDRCYFVSDTH